MGYENSSIKEALHPICSKLSHLPAPCFQLDGEWTWGISPPPSIVPFPQRAQLWIQARWMQWGSTSSQGESPGPCPQQQEGELGVLDPQAPGSICTCTQIALTDQMAPHKTTCSHQQCSKHFLLETCFLSGTCRWFPFPTCKFSKIHLLNWLLCNLHMLRSDCEYLKLATFLK